MREYVWKIDHKKLRGDGANLSAVLRNLCNGEGKKEDASGSSDRFLNKTSPTSASLTPPMAT